MKVRIGPVEGGDSVFPVLSISFSEFYEPEALMMDSKGR